MKKFFKVLKWIVLTIVVVIVVFIGYALLRSQDTFEAPYAEITASTDSTLIARGKYLVYGPAHCVNCHVSPSEFEKVVAGEFVPLSGGHVFALPIGNIYVPNITSDKNTGIGSYSDRELARLFRYGIKRNGHAALDFMPFYDVSDKDITAIISYLRTEPAVNKSVPQNEWNFLGKIVQAFGMIKPSGDGNVPPSPEPDSTIEYGHYLAESVANCRGCHTKRDLMTGGYAGTYYAGQMQFEAFDQDGKIIPGKHMVSPNLTPDKETGRIALWTQDVFIRRIQAGRVIQGSPMPWEAFSKMNESDLKAIYKFLNTLQPVHSETPAGILEGDPE
ncbi:MAG: c-type cytochrome [Ignavibacteria bacterium]|nr:c-type cytochrome [Ignavibacteria bacterium]